MRVREFIYLFSAQMILIPSKRADRIATPKQRQYTIIGSERIADLGISG